MHAEGGGPIAPRPSTSRLLRSLAIADQRDDDEETRRRKRVGVAAGYATIVAPLSLPIQAGGSQVSLVLAFGLSGFAVANLVVLARTQDFQRFVIALISAGAVFVPTATFLVGGLTGSAGGLVWGFLIPAYALLALGPRRSIRWFGVYVAIVAMLVVLDPIAVTLVGPPPHQILLFGVTVNAIVPLGIVFVLLYYTDTRRIAAEARVDELLMNAIPSTIAARLRRGERRIADSYPATSVVFADIVGFTPYARRTPPVEVVDLLDGLFTRFDEIADRYGLEKIKTIGDAYMAVAGAPEPRADHASAALAFGRDTVVAVAELRASTHVPVEVRVGIASGPAVGGVIGQRRLQFDLWGDTVNRASRLEGAGVPGRIQIDEATRALLDPQVTLEPREIEVKGIGALTTYLVG